MKTQYLKEFPTFDFEIPALEGFTDVSYRNDVCPSFSRQLNENLEIVVWVDFKDENNRECNLKQFMVISQEIDGASDNPDFDSEFETDSWDEVIARINEIVSKL